MRRRIVFLTLIAMSMLLSGCWDSKSVQDVNYVVSLGFDYKEGQYQVYVQMLDFSNVAKQEGGDRSGAAIWVGVGRGSSVRQAMDSIYETAQQPMFWGHISSFVFTEPVLRQGVDVTVIDALIRFREIRYTQWVYGTRQPIDAVFNTVPFFHLSPLSSILNEPEGVYEQQSDVKPIRLNRFIAEMREPGETVLLPSLAIDKKVWDKNGKPDSKLYMDGLFAIEGSTEVEWLDRSRMSGLRWLDREAEKLQLSLAEGKRKLGQLSMDRSKHRAKVSTKAGTLVLDLQIEADGKITELHGDMPMDEIRALAEESVKSEIRQTFDYARKKNVDVYSAEHLLYRGHFSAWNELTRSGDRSITDIKLGDVRVKVNITQSGMYKTTVRKEQY